MHPANFSLQAHSVPREGLFGEGSLIRVCDWIQSSPAINSMGFPVRLIDSWSRDFCCITGSNLVVDAWSSQAVKSVTIAAQERIFLGYSPEEEKSFDSPLQFNVKEQFLITAPHLIVGKNVDFIQIPEHHLIINVHKITLHSSQHRLFFEQRSSCTDLEVVEVWNESEK